MTSLPPYFRISPEVETALAERRPVVALESTVITHGLPSPENLTLALEMEAVITDAGAQPCTIALVDGCIRIGVDRESLARLSDASGLRKVSVRDLAAGISAGASGGTTVAATIFAASKAGIRVMATGGIGGVHRAPPFDISADLPELARTPIVVVCAGAKAILDLEATLEYLETWGVPVIGYRTDRFPAFYSTDSGLPLTARADSPGEISQVAQAHWGVGNQGAVLVVVPPPAEEALPEDQMWSAVNQALEEAEQAGIRGQGLTPFLLGRVTEITGGASLKANLGLLRNNGRVAAAISVELG